MLSIITSTTDKILTEYIKDKLKSLERDKTILIVPEQCSFQTEQTMLNLLSEQEANKLTVVSFKRLTNLVFEKTGFPKGERIDDITQNIMIHMCFKKLSGRLNVYSKYADNIEFINMTRDIISEFKKSNITADELIDAANELYGTELGDKTEEIALIYETYRALLENKYTDALDDLSIVYNKLLNYNFFSKKNVIINSFSGFTIQELNIIKLIIKQAKDVFITLPSDKKNKNNYSSLFRAVESTKKRLKKFAEDEGVESEEIFIEDSKIEVSENLSFLTENVFRNNAVYSLDTPENIKIYKAQDIYDEINYVAMMICSEIESGLRYKDISVLLRNEEDYSGIIENIFDKYDIPYFMDKRKHINTNPLMSMVLSLFDIVTKRYKTDDIMKYLKTGLAGISTQDIALLENYVFVWSMDNENWFYDFSNNPAGFSDKFTDRQKENLEKINRIRRQVIEPVKEFERAIKKAPDGAEMTKILYRFLEEINVTGSIAACAENLYSTGFEMKAEEDLRLWEIFLQILDKLYELLKDVKVSIEEFYKILNIAISTQEISFIPQNIDRVDVISVQRMGMSDRKAAFIIGANESEFPKDMNNNGLLSNFQREKLIALGLSINNLDKLCAEEELLVYKTLCVPREKLYVSYTTEDLKGEEKTESVIVREIKRIFPKSEVIKINDIDYKTFIRKKKPAFELLARNWHKKDKIFNSLKEFYKNDEEYKDKFDKLNRLIKGRNLTFIDSKNSKDFFGNNFKLSASQIELYHRCRFAYFCKYGLKIKKRKKAEVDALEYGSLIHYVLEQMLKNNDVEEITTMGYKKLEAKVEKVMMNYVNTNLIGIDREDKQILFYFKRWIYTATLLVLNVARDLCDNDFTAVDFELAIAKGQDIEAFELKGENDEKIIVEG
ncbi:MAG: exodeoxyribonuclease V subunit gamma, partial [Clostridia bacterium]|nr:exodeoxyribonuclease V subunit gamma [Clostridia bacterium]